jgi:hypothetical protein
VEAGLTATGTDVAHGTARATIRSVVWTGLGTYRRSFWRIVLAAVVVFAPVDLVVTLATGLATAYAEESDVLGVFFWSSGTALSVAGTMLGLVFFAGVVDRIVGVDQKGEEDLPIAGTLRGLPTGRLIAASFVSAAIVVAGLLLFLVPGLALMVLFAIVGPLIVIEGLGVRRALRRSAQLTWRHALLVIVTVLIPTTLDEEFTSWFERFAWIEHVWVRVPVDVATTVVVGGLVGVLEVTLAHALISKDRGRREALAGAHATGAKVAPGARAAGGAPTASAGSATRPGEAGDPGADQAAER